MNNLNNPDDWNIRPEQQGDGGSSKWNYALLVPMLGLAAFRWIWSKESQKEIEEAKVMYDQNRDTIQKDLELKYRQTLSENRRETAQMELDLEKELQRAIGYRQALASQSQHLEEERRSLRLERERLENEKSLSGGPGGGLFHEAMGKEEDRERGASVALKEVENRLVERQRAFCSILVPRARRLELEKELLVRTAKEPLLAHLEVEDGLRDIFKNDRSCAGPLNTDERRNGSLMWLYLRYWQMEATLQKHQRAEAALLGLQTKK